MQAGIFGHTADHTFVGNVDPVMDEIEAIKEVQAEKQKNNVKEQNVAQKNWDLNKNSGIFFWFRYFS